ncbi:MAG TPA: hypothetical protein VEA78_00735 [Acidimicrobiales bacterium]|nr:hypothetical protein [Acidimicrobiales bacterium]
MNDDERQFLERSLADLDAERAAGDLSDADHKLLKERYEARLAAPASPPPRSTNPTKVVGVGVLVVALAVGAGFGVMRFAGSREAGETITGDIEERGSAAAQPSASTEPLQRAAELAAAGDVLGALEAYDEVLADDPDDPAALTYKGWLLRNVGTANDEPELLERGVSLLEQASQVDPTFSEAWLFLGIVYYRDQEDPERAVDALRLAIANDPIPDVETAARELLAEIEEKT